MNDNLPEEKEQSHLYNLLSILIMIGVIGIVLWQVFFMLPMPEEPVPEIRSPKINTSLFEDEVFQKLEYFEITDVPDPRLIGRDNPFSPFAEEIILEEVEETIED